MHILALTKYSYEGPSSRYRFYNYKKCFKNNNIYMTIEPFFSKSYLSSKKISRVSIIVLSYFQRFFILINLLIFKNKYKIILIEYELFPYFPAIFEYLFYKRGIKYIVDYDDAIFHKYDINKNKFIKRIFKNKISKVIKYATQVIVCNDYLEDYAKKYNNNIFKLPTVVLLHKYKQEMKQFKKENKKFTIGWIGSKTTSVYILEILPAIQKFVEKYQNIQFNLIGFDKSLLSEVEINKYHINIITWSEKNEIKNLLNFDVGIMPLNDDPWSRGKCGFKLIQYMSCKKPVIASSVGINSSIIENGDNGFLVNNLDEWFDAFEKLYINKKLRGSMAKENFNKMKNEFSYDKNCNNYIKLLKKVKNDRKI